MVAEPEAKARAYLAFSRAAIAFSKFSLQEMQSEPNLMSAAEYTTPVGIQASCVFVCTDWLSDACLGKCSREGDLCKW